MTQLLQNGNFLGCGYFDIALSCDALNNSPSRPTDAAISFVSYTLFNVNEQY